MKRIFLAFLPLVAFADMNTCYMTQESNGQWRIVCEGEGLQYEVVDVTNDVYIIENCEELKGALISVINSMEIDFQEAERSLQNVHDSIYTNALPTVENSSWPNWQERNRVLDSLYQALNYINDTHFYQNSTRDFAFDATNSLKSQIQSIECGSCSTNIGGSGSCCDFGPIIERLIVAEKQRIAITNHLSLISKALYSYDDDFVINERTWLYNFYLDTWQSKFNYFPEEEPYSISSILLNSLYSLEVGVSSLNNFYHGVVQPSFTALQSPSTLLYFDSSVEERDYYTYLTNYYFGMIRKDSDIPSNYKTNWFARIETLLASLVFQDGGKTNYLDSSQDAITNSFQQVYDEFEEHMTGISDFSTEQMKLVRNVEKSMYNNLISFSRAFEDAALPSTVQIINVHKDAGTRSLSSDSIDVSLDVDGKLLHFIEILRSASTLCWVFLGLWMMFKFSVWTVKKIYVLIRYIIDFFNMIIGGK